MVTGCRLCSLHSALPDRGERVRWGLEVGAYQGIEDGSVPSSVFSRRTARMLAALVAAGLILGGYLISSRPVGDQAARKQATSDASGTVIATSKSWDGAQEVTVSWQLPTDGGSFNSRFEMDVTPPYAVGEDFDLLYDPAHPNRGAVPADPTLTNNNDDRTDALMQSLLPFTLAALLLAMFVLWPTKPLRSLSGGGSARSVKRALRRYLVLPVLVCTLFVAASMAELDLSAYSYNIENIADITTTVSIVPLCWIVVRSFRHRRFMRLITIANDAADRNALINRRAGRKIWIDTGVMAGPVQDGMTPGIKMRALAGQDTERFLVADRVRLYTRGKYLGPVLVIGPFGDALIGFAKRRGRRTDMDSPPFQHQSDPAPPRRP